MFLDATGLLLRNSCLDLISFGTYYALLLHSVLCVSNKVVSEGRGVLERA